MGELADTGSGGRPDLMASDPRLAGSRGLGSVAATYERLVATFGEPTRRDDSGALGDRKVRCHWVIQHPGSAAIEICDWKRNSAVRWEQPEIPVERVTLWLVRGTSPDTAAFILASARLEFYES
jgi:hypothetical protein